MRDRSTVRVGGDQIGGGLAIDSGYDLPPARSISASIRWRRARWNGRIALKRRGSFDLGVQIHDDAPYLAIAQPPADGEQHCLEDALQRPLLADIC